MGMLAGMRATVIGAGIGGLVAARALALRGAHVKVLEQAPEISEVGAGLQLSPNAVAVLRGIGLEDRLLNAGAVQAQEVRLVDYKGGDVVRLDLSRLKDQSYYFMHRADLIAMLEKGARDAGVEIELNARVERIEDRPDGATAFMEDGSERHADLIVGADGLHSKLREVLNGKEEPFFTGQVAWRATIPNTMGRGPEAMVHMGPGRHLVCYPLRGGELVNLVAVQERRGWVEEGWNRRDDPANLRAAFADFAPRVQAMLEKIDDVYLWGLFRHEVAKRWHGQHVAILGDAAHPTLPFMAQGAAMAMEDAWVMAASLSGAESIPVGLALYQERRIKRATRVINTATDNAWKYHLSFPPLRFAAHTVMRIGGTLFPEKMLRQFDWLYTFDVTKGASGGF
ncbi:FAD-dependent monooxygenase [Alisedimentitalea sp. MJ-SS2]|uniref:FAD-dependent monooxygenase n=1 Tax=Aliisedimentitalea sp. MJ-SS2 TaxID=3049795 RepID=UPI002915495C|nr:FAD-dependent monooxygenase [Alisedimentitalea sp. MJ-SS2]MDU8926527.1 FAD-dependent monooxygenase [Alisedimentitalea sp. MJ-SS2]